MQNIFEICKYSYIQNLLKSMYKIRRIALTYANTKIKINLYIITVFKGNMLSLELLNRASPLTKLLGLVSHSFLFEFVIDYIKAIKPFARICKCNNYNKGLP